MAEGILMMHKGMPFKSMLPKYEFTGESSIGDEGKVGAYRQWNVSMSSDGTFTPTKDMMIDLFMIAGGGAGNKDGLGGGGGYHNTINCVSLKKGQPYSVDIGLGGKENGADGEPTTAFGYSVQGGKGGKPGEPCYATYRPSVAYFYEGDGSTGEKPENDEINLVYPLVPTTITSGGMPIDVYQGYYVSDEGPKYPSGFYQCYDLGEPIYIHYYSGVTGEGGTETNIFYYDTVVGGPGADSGASKGSRAGQGGAGNGGYGGSNYGEGSPGYVVICNTRHNALEKAGYKSNVRYSVSGGEDVEANGWDITGYIPVSYGDVVRLKNVEWKYALSSENGGRGSIYMYNADKSHVGNLNSYNSNEISCFTPVLDEEGNIVQITINYLEQINPQIAYIRICCQDLKSSSVITVNQEIH